MIGWSQNTRTVVRQLFSLEIINVTDSLNVLSCNEFRSFWVTWHNGLLRVGNGYVSSDELIIEARVSGIEKSFRVELSINCAYRIIVNILS